MQEDKKTGKRLNMISIILLVLIILALCAYGLLYFKRIPNMKQFEFRDRVEAKSGEIRGACISRLSNSNSFYHISDSPKSYFESAYVTSDKIVCIFKVESKDNGTCYAARYLTVHDIYDLVNVSTDRTDVDKNLYETEWQCYMACYKELGPLLSLDW